MVDRESQMMYIENDIMKYLKIKKKRIKSLMNSDNAIDMTVDIFLIVFDVIASPILIVVRVGRYIFNKLIRDKLIGVIKWILNRVFWYEKN